MGHRSGNRRAWRVPYECRRNERHRDELSGTAIQLNATTTMSGGDSKETSSKWRVTQTSKQRTRTVAMVWPFAIAVALLLTFEAGAWITQSRRLL